MLGETYSQEGKALLPRELVKKTFQSLTFWCYVLKDESAFLRWS